MAEGSKKKKAGAGRKRGPKSKISELNLNQVKKLARLGTTEREMAEFFSIPHPTWKRWKMQNKALREAINAWKETADDLVERSLFERAVGYSHPEDKIFFDAKRGDVVTVQTIKHYPPDPLACTAWLNNRRPDDWKNRKAVDITEKKDTLTTVLEKASAKLYPKEKKGKGKK